jgi:hypothetical protein
VRIHLPGQPTPVLCVGDVVWTREEVARSSWRSGVQFSQADEAAIEAFIITHAEV